MTSARAPRSVLCAAVTAAVVLASSLAAAGSATADPVPPPSPATSSPTTPLPTTGSDAPDDVLILHTDTTAGTDSPALRNALHRLGATVRHSFPKQQTISVHLPAGRRSSAPFAGLPGVREVERPVARHFTDVPNDTWYARQRHYLNAVNAPAAWDTEHGSSAVRIAVIDTGVDVNHPDLAGKIVGRYNADNGGTSVTDTMGHGTFVAGVAAARTGNRLGVAGAGYDTSLLAIKIIDRYDEISIDDEVAGIRWAADHGAAVINLSLSGPDASNAERKAIAYAQGKGVLIVAAAGNDGTSARQYPAAYPGVLSVGATDANGHRASFSTYGSWVSMAAPGTSITSTTPTRGSDYFRPGYGLGNGTSFAAPLVAGAAGLLKAQNPATTGSQLRAALLASAHGYARLGLGRGQVDFRRAQLHIAPTSLPSQATASGRSGTITFSTPSTAPRVAFRVDNDSRTAPAAVRAGVARLTFSSYGYADGAHTLRAYNCTAYGECNPAGRATTFQVANPTPALDSPAASEAVSGRFTATGSGPGGGLRLLVDGREAAFDASAPFTFSVNASRWSNGQHDLVVQTCTSTRSHCAGPRSGARSITFASLHPAITALSRTRISPNGDRVADTSVVAFTLDEPQNVTVEIRDARDQVRRRGPLGVLAAGKHTWTWRGVGADGRRLPDGVYRIVLATSRQLDSITRYGETERSATIDTTAPRLSAVLGARATVFPARDGYRDTFTPSAAIRDGGLLNLTVRNPSGRVVRSLTSVRRPSSRAVVTWDGRTAGGRVVPAGTYWWRLSVRDDVGNTRSSSAYRVFVSAKRLRVRTAALTRIAKTGDVGGTAPCAHRVRPVYGHGVGLVNGCPEINNDVAYARFAFGLPVAHAYRRLSVWVHGRSVHTSEISASFQRVDGGLELPGSRRVAGSSRTRWVYVGGVPAAGHVAHRRAYVSVILSSRYAPRNDIDIGTIQLRVTFVYLG